MEKSQRKKERLDKSASCLEISCFRRIKVLFGTLKGPLALLMLREDMVLAISSWSVGWINIELLQCVLSIQKSVYENNQCSALQYNQLS